MFLRKYWLPLSVFVVAIVGVGLYMLATRPPPETVKIYKTVKPIEKPTQQPTVEAPVGDTSQGGHFHADGTFHADPHDAPVESPPVVQPKSDVSAPVGSEPPFHDPYFRMIDGFAITSEFAIAIAPSGVGPNFESMSDEELAAAITAINSNHGYPPGDLWPPEDYDYAIGGTTVLSDGDNVWLDDNGHPILIKRGTPYFEISWPEGFRPPPDVYADYKALHERYIEAFMNVPDHVNTSPELERISAEKDAMEQMYRGPVPSVFLSGSRPPSTEPHTYYAQFRWAKIQMQRSAFEKAGLAYLMDRYDSLKEFAK